MDTITDICGQGTGLIYAMITTQRHVYNNLKITTGISILYSLNLHARAEAVAK